MEEKKPSAFKTIIGMMINPADALKSAMLQTKWYFSVGVCSFAFALFFLQTGLDLYKTGQKGLGFVWVSIFSGLFYGLLVIPLIGYLIWLILKMSKSDKTMQSAISSFCLSYSGALVYGVLGLVFSLIFSWKTSVAFGVTGVLWAIGPMIVTIRELTGGKNKLSIPIATIVCGIVLISWTLFGKI